MPESETRALALEVAVDVAVTDPDFVLEGERDGVAVVEAVTDGDEVGTAEFVAVGDTASFQLHIACCVPLISGCVSV